MDDAFWNKKIRVTFILSVLVLTLHISTVEYYDFDSMVITRLFKGCVFLITEIAQVAVPLFFVISGVLFFRNYTIGTTFSKIKKRFVTLFVPYICWNIIHTAYEMIISNTPIHNLFAGREITTLNVRNILSGIFLYKFYGPFWFIFALWIFIFASPLIYVLLKSKAWGGYYDCSSMCFVCNRDKIA